MIDTTIDISNINSKSTITNKKITYTVGKPIHYVCDQKKFSPCVLPDNSGNPFMGLLFNYNDKANTVDVLYKDFLLKDPISIAGDIREDYAQIYVLKEFEKYKAYIKSHMPRVKKLKRLNLKIMNRQQVNYLYQHIDDFIFGYELGKGTEYSQIMKAAIVTTPFFCYNDYGQLKVYKFETNELFDIDVDTEANFLCYFTFEIK